MIRGIRTPWYNWLFNTDTGGFCRWGRTQDEDPSYSPIGPEILDIEVSTICHGPGKPCKHCYKSNGPAGINMSFDTFKKIFDRIGNRNLTQIAFGIGDIDGNPDLYEMMAYCRGNMVVPNITINGWRASEYHYNMLARLCGAISVSHYDDKSCFDAVQELTSRGVKQVNIHQILAGDTYEECLTLIKKATKDPRLKKLNAIIFLLLKPKGDRNKLRPIDHLLPFKELFQWAQTNNIRFGVDSCSAPNLMKATEEDGGLDLQSVEPCESTLFSLYVNAKGEAFPCSFAEGNPDWKTGIPVLEEDSFLGGVWYNPRLIAWRKKLLNSCNNCTSCKFQQGCRSCPEYDITICRHRRD